MFLREITVFWDKIYRLYQLTVTNVAGFELLVIQRRVGNFGNSPCGLRPLSSPGWDNEQPLDIDNGASNEFMLPGHPPIPDFPILSHHLLF